MHNSQHFPLSDHARIDVALRIMKCELPFRVNAMPEAHHLKMSEILPPSSPVLKKGFEMDARDWLRVLNHLKIASIQDDIKTLSRLRDLWAHQQDLKAGDATRFCETASDLMSELNASEIARVLSILSAPSPFPAEPHSQAESYRELCQLLDLDPDDQSDLRRFFKYLVWQAAQAKTTGALALAITLENDLEDETDGLPPTLFNWVLDLSSDAPAQMVRASVRHSRALLDERGEDAY
ncbi:hypothetical protein [Ponticaulis koreensis]|uniref:hypothetical protein n=1 Tax=Ponticaulis koreensis TaxID=1123045 RepID=UPI0003B3251A|nr:hypothetical protein [Ponticaulis koreensis]